MGKVSQEELAAWERLGEGGFSSVYKAKLKGNDVAVKVLKNLKETKSLLTEGNLLRYVLKLFCIHSQLETINTCICCGLNLSFKLQHIYQAEFQSSPN